MVLLEPHHESRGVDLNSLALGAEQVLIVLPKRMGRASSEHAGHIESSEFVPTQQGESLLATVGVDGWLLREEGALEHNWSSAGPWPVMSDAQLIYGSELEPLVASNDGGVLLGRYTHYHRDGDRGLQKEIYVLSDPDLLQTHGLVDEANVSFVLWMMEELRGGSASAC